MSEYIVGATYKASAAHIIEAKRNQVTFNKEDATFKVAALGPDGGAWSHDASYAGVFDPEIKDVGVYCAEPNDIESDELISLPAPEGVNQ